MSWAPAGKPAVNPETTARAATKNLRKITAPTTRYQP